MPKENVSSVILPDIKLVDKGTICEKKLWARAQKEKKERMKTIWKGHIRFSLVNIPIQLYSAVNSGTEIRFNQLHKKDFGRIRYQKVCEACDEVMGRDDIVKGYQYEDDKYVVVEKQEFKNIKLKSTKVIEIEVFVDLDEVHPTRYESLYYVGPREAAAGATYNLFVAALEKTGKAGVGKLVLRDKEDVVLVMAHKKRLVMYKLRYPDELKEIEDVPEVSVEDVADEQLNLAKTLIKSLEKGFDQIEFFDEYQHEMRELIDAKIEGKEVIQAAEPEAEPILDITDALKASIENAKKARK